MTPEAEQQVNEAPPPPADIPEVTNDGDKRRFVYNRPWMYEKQEQAFFNDARYSLTEASTKAGKTVAGIVWLFEQAFNGNRGENYWWVAPVFPQAEIAFTRMLAAYPREVIYQFKQTDMSITLLNGAVIKFKSGEKPDNLYGEDVYAAVVDEASRLREESWYALRSTVTATRGPIRFIGNVKGRKNWFYAMCRNAEKEEAQARLDNRAPSMTYHKIVAGDAVAAGVLEDKEIEGARRELPENIFRELYLAEAADDGGNPFGLSAIAACVQPISSKAPCYWGWDLAKSIDWSVGIALDEDGAVCRFVRFQKPWSATMEDILRNTKSVRALVDSTGVGDPILEMLQKHPGTRFEGYTFNQQSKQKLMEGLAVKIQQGEIAFPDGIIRNELDSFEYEYTRTGVRYSAPENMNLHDDCVMALALACMHSITLPPALKISPELLARAKMPSRYGRPRPKLDFRS